MRASELHRRFRPRQFDEVVGQDQAVGPIVAAIEADRVASVYLFTGPTGCGKSTLASLLSMAVNCTDLHGVNPCHRCPSCRSILEHRNPDIYEVDSSTGSEGIRSLAERLSFTRVGKRRVVRIDAAQVLSSPATSSLIPLLDWPPAHTIFILMADAPKRVLRRLESRAVHLPLQSLPLDVVVARLRVVADSEKPGIQPSTLIAAASHAPGDLRDALSMLEVSILTGQPPSTPTRELVRSLITGDRIGAFTIVAEADATGIRAEVIAWRTLGQLRDVYLAQMGAAHHVRTMTREESIELAAMRTAEETITLMNDLGDAVRIMALTDIDQRVVLEIMLGRLTGPARQDVVDDATE